MSNFSFFDKVEESLKGLLLDKQPFGKTKQLIYWIKSKDISEVSQILHDQEDLKISKLEDISCFISDESLVLSYFFLSSHYHKQIIIRFAIAFKNENEVVSVASVTKHWPSAYLVEKENAEMFGVEFTSPNREMKIGFTEPLFVEKVSAYFYMRSHKGDAQS